MTEDRKESRTRWEGVRARHSATCRYRRGGSRCSCGPSGYIARVTDPRTGGKRSSGVRRTPAEAINWRNDTLKAIRAGEELAAERGTFADIAHELIDALAAGTVKTRGGRSYKPQARRDIENALRVWVLPRDAIAAKAVTAVRRSDVQALVDHMAAEGLSGSRIRTVRDAIAVVYTYARTRYDVETMPTVGLALPGRDERPRGWSAPGVMPTPAQLDALLDALPRADRLPFALAAMTSARRQEMLNLDWPHVDFERDQVALADAADYAKSLAATRIAPLVPQLKDLLLEEWVAQGRPDHGLVCRPRQRSKRGRLSIEALYTRCDRRWTELGLSPLRLHVARHACASYLRAAGVPLKVRSAILGHASTSALSMTEDRYTHLMPGDLEAAKDALAAYLRTSRNGSGNDTPDTHTDTRDAKSPMESGIPTA
jgi:integrase